MADTQTVIIEFQSDFSSLESGIDVLEKAGKVDAELAAQFKKTNQEINKQGKAFDTAAASANKETQSLKSLSDLMKQFPKSGMNRFLLQIGNELAAAGLEAEDFVKKVGKEVPKTTQQFSTLRQELKSVKEQMQQAALTGGILSEEYLKLKERAGQLDDTIKDVSSDISNAGSDTRGIDNVVGSISALAGGYSALQGAAALFGDENEDLQKTLVKVNAAMAVASGIQQVLNATTKQGALTRLIDVTATHAQIAAQKIYTFVTGRATAATVAFKVALAATGIGLVVLAVVALANAFSEASDETEDLIEDLERLKRVNEGLLSSLNRNEREDISLLELRGAKESEISKLRLKNSADRIRLLKQEKIAAENLLRVNTKNGEVDKEVSDKFTEANQAYLNALTDRRVLINDIKRQEIDEAKEVADARKQAAEKALEAERKARLAGFEDFKAGVELQLLKVKEGSEEELALKKKLANAQLLVDLENENLTFNQRKLLIQKFFKERIQLEKDFGKAREQIILENIASDLDAELRTLNLSNERKLELTEAAINIAAELEINAAKDNASKITQINAKRDAAIRDARLASLNAVAEYEIALSDAVGGTKKRALERVGSDERKSFEVRINAINQLAEMELGAIQRRIDANQAAYDQMLISQEEFNLKSAQLNDQYAQAWENTENRKVELSEQNNERIKEDTIAKIQIVIETLTRVVDTLSSIYDNQAIADSNRINGLKRELEELKDAGAITEKEAIQRQKRIEAEERKAKNRQAIRDKQIAVFNAILGIPSAIIQGLKQGGPILAAIYGALAAAQAAIVIARPVPKFAKGKKDNYSGLGMVGEAGTEMIERNGRLYVTTKPTITYLGPKDKVFTAAETKRMMPSVNKNIMNQTEGIDYDKLAQKIAAAISGQIQPAAGTEINIDRDFISESVANGLQRNNYWGKYYSSKG